MIRVREGPGGGRMHVPPYAIAIDGPAASGKSTTARMVAERLGFVHVDSGALYRAATAAFLRLDEAEMTEEDVLRASIGVSLDEDGDAMVPVLDGSRLDEELRSSLVTRHVSRVAQMPLVRDWVNERVRRAASGRSVVADGRDIGTAVLPDADLKVFLVADPWERARRRLVQRLGRDPSPDEVAAETDRLVQRDASDATQTVQAKDAILIDTTLLTQPEQVDRIVALANAVTRFPDATSSIDSPGE